MSRVRLIIIFSFILGFFCFAHSASATANVYYSVGQNTASLLAGTSVTMTITTGAAVFSVAQTNNIGVGDYIEYGTAPYTRAYISAKSDADQKHWSVVTATGGAPPDVTDAAVNSIKHTFSTLNGAVAGASGANYINNTDLTAADVVLNISCYYDSAADTTAATVSGYITDATRYIKIYTPNNISTEANTSQRHQGKWDDTKYSLAVSSVATSASLNIDNAYVRVEGLQISLNPTSGTLNAGVLYVGNGVTLTTADVKISNNILKKTGSNNAQYQNGIAVISGNSTKIWNNIIYDTAGGTQESRGIIVSGATAYAYNNTINNSTGYGMIVANGTIAAKNNIVQNSISTADYAAGTGGSFTGSVNNISHDNTSPNSGATDCGGHSCRSQTVAFADASIKDYHLAFSDTSARDSGADLSADATIAISTDIDGHARNAFTVSGAYDIGADEGAMARYRSVGAGATAALATTAQGGTLSISGGVGTFTTAPGTAIGVGDAVQYDKDDGGTIDSIAFITGRTDSTHYTLQKADGTAANTTSTPDADWGIYRAYTSLSNAEKGVENTGINTTYRNFDDWTAGGDATTDDVGRDTYANNEQWNIACYANGTAADTTAVTVSGWTTALPNYLKIYTPYTTSEVGTSQRHTGKWDDTKYKMEISAGNAINISEEYVMVGGLQIKVIAGDNSRYGIVTISIANPSLIKISNNIIKGQLSGTSNYSYGIISADNDSVTQVWNNIVYGFINAGYTAYGILNLSGTMYAYSNTAYNCGAGLYRNAGTMYAKNNISYNNTDNYSGTFDGTSTNNLSGPGSDAQIPSANAKDGVVVNFVSTTADSEDFHLTNNNNASAINLGADLSGDSGFAFASDIDGQTRASGKWDIGADENNNMVIDVKRNVNFGRGVIFK